jgi:signal transduction histidine kinase/CheY-like chemotaxis protein
VSANDDGLDAAVAHAQLRQLNGQTLRAFIALLVLDSFLLWLLARLGLAVHAMVWMVSNIPLQALCASLAARAASSVQPRRAVRRCEALIVALGWQRAAILPFVFARPVGEVHYLLTLLLVGQMAGAGTTAGAFARAYFGWGLPIAGALAAGWWWHGGMEQRWLSVLLLLLFFGLVANATAASRRLRELVRLAREHEGLAMAKSRFFAAANHDLRQPLHALAVNATTLEVLARRQPDPLIKDLSLSISRSLQQSHALLDALLDLSRMDAKVMQVSLAPVDLVALARAVAGDLHVLAQQRQLVLRCDVPDLPVDALADRELVTRVLQNLVGNAIKFTERGEVVVRVWREADQAVLAVADTGIGIAPHEQARVFEEFYQAGQAAGPRAKGLGLGLSIVQRAVRLMNARLTMDSRPGVGTCVSVAFVATHAGQRAPAPPAPAVPLPPGLKVLLVDDDDEVRRSMRGLLLAWGCVVRDCRAAADAWTALRAGFEPDVLLVDQRLPDTQGSELLRQLQARLGLRPAVLMTGGRLSDELPSQPMRHCRVVHKPLDGWRLAAEVSALLQAGSASLPPTA